MLRLVNTLLFTRATKVLRYPNLKNQLSPKRGVPTARLISRRTLLYAPMGITVLTIQEGRLKDPLEKLSLLKRPVHPYPRGHLTQWKVDVSYVYDAAILEGNT